MSNTISQPDSIDLNRTARVDTWQFPVTAEVEFDPANPVTAARAEYNQHQYAESLVHNDGVEPTGVDVDTTGNAIDPANAEAVLSAAAEVVDAYEAAPESSPAPEQYYRNDGTPIDTAHSEAIINAAEQHVAAVAQSQIYARRVAQMRQWGFDNWGAQSPN